MPQSRDYRGARVRTGTRVRVLKISPSVFKVLSKTEAARVRSMQGEVFKVDEIDEWGGAWVTKWWQLPHGRSYSHSLSLESEQMEVVRRVPANSSSTGRVAGGVGRRRSTSR
jgi:hypothetical protein